MKKHSIYLTFLLILLSIVASKAQEKTTISPKDFEVLVGMWQGSLTYLDYSSGKPYTMPADVEIKRIPKTNSFVFSNLYPKEPKANAADTIIISTDGKYIDKQLIKSVKKLKDAGLEIITEETGKDGNDSKQATFRHTYIISKKVFVKKKEIQFVGETTWVKRHEYAYKAK
jgi:hypothetical protein